MISEMINESGGFSFDDVVHHCAEKMIRRHPHVFGETTLETSKVNKKWEEIKAKENQTKALWTAYQNIYQPCCMPINCNERLQGRFRLARH